ncbi:MAG: hypothetical protein R3C26_07435 [Calditrichia bacterium]
MFFRNNGNGFFNEVSAQLGLNAEGDSRASVLRGFDNDGAIDIAVLNVDRGEFQLFNNRNAYEQLDQYSIGWQPETITVASGQKYLSKPVVTSKCMKFVRAAAVLQPFAAGGFQFKKAAVSMKLTCNGPSGEIPKPHRCGYQSDFNNHRTRHPTG